MDELPIKYNPEYIKIPKPWWKTKVFWALAILAFFVGYFSFRLGLAYNTIVVGEDERVTWWSKIVAVLPFGGKETPIPTPDPYPLPEEEDNRLDVLILGIRGEDDLANGGLLTDSILILSVDKQTDQTAIVSLPRDLFINVGGVNSKLNEVYEKGLANGNSFQFSKEIISRIAGVYIDKMAVLDFNGFVGIIDKVGGIDINLAKDFIEPEQWGYEFYLPAGDNHLDGQQALYYVRSRYSTNDFDRSRRQQQVLLALKSKILSLGTLLNPIKVSGLISEFKGNVRTDIGVLDIGDMLKILSSTSKNKPETFVISTDNLVYQKIEDGIYKLLPIGDSYDQIKNHFKNNLNVRNN